MGAGRGKEGECVGPLRLGEGGLLPPGVYCLSEKLFLSAAFEPTTTNPTEPKLKAEGWEKRKET